MRIGSIIAALLVASCSRNPPPDPYESALRDFERGFPRKALAAAAAHRKAASSGPLTELDWRMRMIEAESLLNLGQNAEAAGVLEPAMPASAPPALRSWRLALLGMAANGPAADRFFAQALEADSDAASQARARSYMASRLVAKNEFGQGEKILLEARRLAEQARYPYLQAGVARNYCFAALQRERHDIAAVRCEESLELAKLAGALRLERIAHANLASAYAPLGDFDRALEHAAESLRLASETSDVIARITAENGFGAAYFYMRRMSDAATHYENAYRDAAEIKNARFQSGAASNLAAIHQLAGNWNEAERWNNLSRDLAGPLPNFTLNEGGIAVGRGDPETGFAKCLQVAAMPGVKAGLVWEAEACMAYASVKLGRFAGAYGHFEAAIRKAGEYRGDLSADSVKITFQDSLIRLHREYVDVLVRQGHFERALEVVESSRAPILSARLAGDGTERVTAATYRNISRHNGLLLVSYWLDDPASYAWVVTPDAVHWVSLPGKREIERQVAAFQQLVVNNLGDPRRGGRAGAALARSILDPIREFVPPGSKVAMALDGPLHRLNPETLPVADPAPHFWIEDVTLAIAPSLSLLASPPGASPPAAMLLASGAAGGGAAFPPLRHAETEIGRIAAHFPGTKPVRDATPDWYEKANPADYAYIHFTAHGDTQTRDPMKSAIILAEGAGGNRLFASDTARIPLRAKLVTISACKGAGSRNYAGEGLIGFAWSFLHAGARNVIAGLWDVSDSATVDLMDGLYGGLARGAAPAEALRSAKLALLRSGRSLAKPFYWGPFVVFTRTPSGG